MSTESEDNPDDAYDIFEIIIRLDVTDISKAVAISQQKGKRNLTMSSKTVVEILTDRILTEVFEIPPPDVDLTKPYGIIDDVLHGDYNAIMQLLLGKITSAIGDIMNNEEVIGRSTIRVVGGTMVDFALYSQN